jgi:hypothetical protein
MQILNPSNDFYITHITKVSLCSSQVSRLMFWKHLGFKDAPFAAGFLEITLIFQKCRNAPFWARFLGMVKSKHIRKIEALNRRM